MGRTCVGVVSVSVPRTYEVVLLWVCLLATHALKEVRIEGPVCWVELGEFLVQAGVRNWPVTCRRTVLLRLGSRI